MQIGVFLALPVSKLLIRFVLLKPTPLYCFNFLTKTSTCLIWRCWYYCCWWCVVPNNRCNLLEGKWLKGFFFCIRSVVWQSYKLQFAHCLFWIACVDNATYINKILYSSLPWEKFTEGLAHSVRILFFIQRLVGGIFLNTLQYSQPARQTLQTKIHRNICIGK